MSRTDTAVRVISARLAGPGVRVVQPNEFVSRDPASDGTTTMTWEVTPVDAQSRVDIRADDVPDGTLQIMRRDCRPRWTISPLAATIRVVATDGQI